MCAGTNRAGFQKDPVTLRDSPKEGGGPKEGSLLVLFHASWYFSALYPELPNLVWPIFIPGFLVGRVE